MKITLLTSIIPSIMISTSAFAASESPAGYLKDLALGADSAVIEFYAPSGKEEVSVSDKAWIARFAGILARGSYVPQSHCLCISYPQVHLYRGKEKVGTFSVHHAAKLRAYAGRVSGDFLVGAETGRAISELASEKKKG